MKMSQRKVPLWMRKTPHHEQTDNWPAKLANTTVTERVASPVKDDEPQKRRLRSNYAFPAEEKKQPYVQMAYFPFVDYTGAIEYYTTLPDMAFRCHQMLEELLQQSEANDKDIPIAFDMEWPFSFQTGPGRTALMQLCATTDRCVLFQLSCIKRLPAALLQLLYHPRVVLHGVNIKNDFRKLARDFPEVDADRLIARCVDLGVWYKELDGSTGRWSLALLVEQVLKRRMNKDKRVRMSKWDVLPLTDDQKLYAAIDVYIGQKLYLALAAKQSELENAIDNVLEEVDAAVESKTVPQGAVVGEKQLPLSNSNNNPQPSPAKL